MLNPAQRDELMALMHTWGRFYELTSDGETWTATRRADPGTVLTAPTCEALKIAIRADCATDSDGSYWVETCSGPPYIVRPPQLPLRIRNSGT
jgi:hypothetical protein